MASATQQQKQKSSQLSSHRKDSYPSVCEEELKVENDAIDNTKNKNIDGDCFYQTIISPVLLKRVSK